jgi:alkylation response protein AidB-like acyl-CoA dehydrogenase
MPDHDYQIDLRDIRFNLYEALPFHRLAELPAFAELDRESVDLMLDECYRFNREVMAPLNRPGDRAGCTFEDGVVRVPEGFTAAYRAFCANGWLGVTTPEALGGMGLPNVVGAATSEMYIGSCCSLALSIGLTHAAVSLLQAHGSEELKRDYLPKLVSGEWQGTMCLTEPQAGTAVGDIKALARPDGNGGYLLSGTKSFITAGEHDMCENHVHLVLARTPGAPKGFKGISLFLVPRYLPDGAFNDVVCAGIEHKLGIKASPTCTMSFGEEGHCRALIVGNEGEGLRLMFHMMNEARVGVGLQSVALAAQAYLYARDYALERVQGVDIEQMRNLDAPRVVIAEHPDVRRMLLWCKAMVEGCRALLYFSAYQSDLALNSPDTAEAERAFGLLELLTPICKAYVSDRAFEVTRVALQVMGGYGYVSEYPVEQHLRDVKIASIYEGTNGIQALDLLGRKLPSKGGQLLRALLGEIQGFVDAQRGHLALGGEVAAFAEEMGRWSQTTMQLGAMGMSGEQRYPVLCATPYLELAGNTVVAWLLLRQAVLAHDRLQSLYLDRGALDPQAREALCRDDPDVALYFNKVEAARFFVHQILSGNRAIAAQIQSGDRSALTYLP